MKILLICPPIRETSPANSVPLGTGYIASSLREKRHNVEVLDINCFRYSREIVENLIKKSTHEAIGIGALTSQYGRI
jgi:hypothetical protein